ncbi:hypothetical protein RchiOBHm_Chr4g0446391 [Rosa chinensis]|uniref:Uncharacterized protein n=1 Tax=Rosa chinensis TaxID=74649 RepID=A0A2P6R4M7_ROSCH|nr:protein BPS1, chloroplastic [Rosa chinensis]PRQ41391.1 hypothetical protein RchiOBHm_Chr4g0446391 [Rosa chinensis]
MFLTEIKKHAVPSFTPFKKHSVPNKFGLITNAFDDALLRRLKTLSPPSISLSWLSKAVDFLAFSHSEARSLISNLEVTALDDSLATYLDDSVKLLDICNSVSAEIERLRQRRIVLAFAVHLLRDGKLLRARETLTEWEGRRASGFGKADNAEVLVRDLALGLGSTPRGKISSVGRVVRRTMYAVRLVTVFVAGAVVSAMNGSAETVTVRTPAEFSWAESLNELESAVSGELKRLFGKEAKRKGTLLEEVDDVATRVAEACEIAEEDTERRNDVVKEVEGAMGSFSDGLEGLSKRVNEMFHGVLSNRNYMLDHVRVRA